MRNGRKCFRNCFIQSLIVVLVISIPVLAKSKINIPPEITSAKTIYLVDQTGDQYLLDYAHEQFKTWGRFTIANSEDSADIVAVFTHKWGMDKWSNVSFIEMDVFVKGHSEPAFSAKNAVKLIIDPQHRTRACIADFRKVLEPKP